MQLSCQQLSMCGYILLLVVMNILLLPYFPRGVTRNKYMIMQQCDKTHLKWVLDVIGNRSLNLVKIKCYAMRLLGLSCTFKADSIDRD